MDLEKIKKLMAAMEERKITKLALKEKSGVELELERDSEFQVEPYPKPLSSVQTTPPPVIETPAEEEVKEKEGEKVLKAQPGYQITSPMVGTFYAGPSSEEPSFVKVGDLVDEDTVVCIVEAMKVMNEVRAGKKGRIAEILIENADPVEFGTKLFRLVEL